MEMAVNNHTYYEERYRRVKALWLAVFIRAARDYTLWRDEKKDVEKRKLAEDARRFIFDATSGFADMCTVFDLDVGRLRHRAETMTREDVRKIEMLERGPSRELATPEVELEELTLELE